MVQIRLLRTGRKKAAYFRLVATDSRSPRDGKFLENLGYYSPVEGSKVHVRMDRVDFWRAQGAQVTLAASNALRMARKASA